MNSKKGGSLASNHVLRLLKGDCKKGGKRTRTKRSKSKKRKVVKKKTMRKTGKRSKSGKKRSKSRRKTKSNKMRGGGKEGGTMLNCIKCCGDDITECKKSITELETFCKTCPSRDKARGHPK